MLFVRNYGRQIQLGLRSVCSPIIYCNLFDDEVIKPNQKDLILIQKLFLIVYPGNATKTACDWKIKILCVSLNSLQTI